MQPEVKLEEDAIADGFLNGRLSVLQPVRDVRAGIDPVFLAASIEAKSGERILDVGAGVGVASLCLGQRLDVGVWGLEIHPWLADLFSRNIKNNNFSGRIHAVEGDLFAPIKHLEALGLKQNGFDHIFTNPPFYTGFDATPPSEGLRALAHINNAGLDRWLGRCCGFLRSGGSLSVIYPASALGELLPAASKRLGGICLYFLWSGKSQPASRVLLRGTLGSKAPLHVLPGMTVHNPDGSYSSAAQTVLREGTGIAMNMDRF